MTNKARVFKIAWLIENGSVLVKYLVESCRISSLISSDNFSSRTRARKLIYSTTNGHIRSFLRRSAVLDKRQNKRN